MFSYLKIETFIVVGDQCGYHVKYDHPAPCCSDGLPLQKVGLFEDIISPFFSQRSIPSGKSTSRFDKVFTEKDRIFAASHTVLSNKVIQEASDKGLVKLPEKSFQRPPNANDAPEGWPAYCYFIGWLFTLLCIAGRMHVILWICVRGHFLYQCKKKLPVKKIA